MDLAHPDQNLLWANYLQADLLQTGAGLLHPSSLADADPTK